MKARFLFVAAMLVFSGLFTINCADGATVNVTTAAEFQTALNAAQANGESDTINVAAGTYNIASSLTYTSAENYDLAITGAGAATTVLDGGSTVQIMRITFDGNGDFSISGLTFERGRVFDIAGFGAALYVLNNGTGSTLVDQCTMTNGTAIRNTAGAWLGTSTGDITVTDSSFTHNICDEGTADDGCGLYLYFDGTTATGNAVVRNNDISYNTLNHNPAPVGNCDGAGLMIYHLGTDSTAPAITIENNTITNNLSYEGAAGVSVHMLHQQGTATVTGNTFSDNTAGPLPAGIPIQLTGGAIELYCDGGTLVVTDNQFLGNRNLDVYGLSGGLAIANLPTGSLRLANNVFVNNQSSGTGGGALVNVGAGATSVIIAGNLFVNNQAGLTDGSGGGLSLSAETDVTLVNNTFYNNTAADGGGLGYYAERAGDAASVANDIYWGNTPNSIAVFGVGPVAATSSNIDGGTGQSYFGTGCIDTDPLFFNAASPAGADGLYATMDDGLHLTAASPSADTGSIAAVPAALGVDVAGQARILGDAVDMGAYEGEAGASVVTTTAVSSTTTTASSTTTSVPGGGLCPSEKVLGPDSPELAGLRAFRDSTLAKSATGRWATALYYRHADSLNAALERSPALRALARRVLEALAPLAVRKEN